ncbi:uncharacterized protein LOC131858915 [Cryptomeria japonica]|uniref:uncharacterized protein LOC131858915 n=1 Tax=Cryptomeria japonica TaxID=3369 RepID=UPI0027DAA98B|nr:uncharacterized protein LOC131858915 [Cryptomeria japonica]
MLHDNDANYVCLICDEPCSGQPYGGECRVYKEKSIVTGYTPPNNSPSTPDEKEYENNAKAKNAILCGLSNSEFVKVMHCKIAKEIWDKLHSIYEGDDTVKQAKLQTYRAQFEGLKMKKEERIAEYLLKVDEVVNAIKGRGEEVKDAVNMKEVLRKDGKSKREVAFKVVEVEDSEIDQEEANFVKRLKRGSEDVTKPGNEEHLFMAIAKVESEKNDNDEEEEVEVDLEGELISALNELDLARAKNQKYKKKIEESEALSLKTKIEEAKKIEDTLTEKLQVKEKECELLETRIVCLKKYDKSIEALDNMLSKQRKSNILTGLGCKKGHCSNSTVIDKKKCKDKISDVFVKVDDKRKDEERIQSVAKKDMTIDEKSENRETERFIDVISKKKRFKRTPPARQQAAFRFNHSFPSYCFSCNKFGHKATDCRLNIRTFISQKPFAPLADFTTVCYKCNNLGHIEKFCRSGINSPKQEMKMNTHQGVKETKSDIDQKKETKREWKVKKEKHNIEKSLLVQAAFHAQDENDTWYVDSGCSNHMTGDTSKFLSLKENCKGTIRFGSNDSATIVGKGSISFDNGWTTTQNVFYVEGLRHNLLSVSQMYDNGYNVVFHKKGCDIKKNGRVIADAHRTDGNLYILNKLKERNGSKCLMSQKDES